MMNARVDDEEKSNFVFGVDDPTKPGVMKDDAEIAMNKKLYDFQEKSTKVTQQNKSISKEHDRKIVRPYVEGQLKSLKLKTVGGLTPVEQLYKFRSVSNESGTKTEVTSKLLRKYEIIGFLEDRRKTLIDIKQTPDRKSVPCYLADWGYLKNIDRLNLPYQIKLVELKNLNDLLAI